MKNVIYKTTQPLQLLCNTLIETLGETYTKTTQRVALIDIIKQLTIASGSDSTCLDVTFVMWRVDTRMPIKREVLISTIALTWLLPSLKLTLEFKENWSFWIHLPASLMTRIHRITLLHGISCDLCKYSFVQHTLWCLKVEVFRFDTVLVKCKINYS